MQRFKRIGALLGAVIVLFACSTEKNRWLNRTYHKTTTHYNYWFNANEVLKSGVKKIEGAHKEDYSEIIPLYVYGNKAAAQASFTDMEKVIEKSSNAIHMHSMRIKRRERNKWIDDCYMLIGKAYFYKKEYYDANESFKYVYAAHKNDPMHIDGLLWMIRNHMEQDDMTKARDLLTKMEDEGMPEELRGDFYGVYADWMIRNKDYEEAIKMLNKAINHTKRKKDRERMTYVLAQLYHRDRDYKKATRYYSEVIKMRPEFEMEFNARIHRAQAYDIASGTEKVKKELNKMLRDKKNADYNDQIYYALAELAFREGEEEKGITFLRKSAASSTSNVKQKTRSYLRLAKYYYNKSDYLNAQVFYDSTASVIPKTYEFYDDVIERSESLNELVKHLNIISEEDSLQLLVRDPKKRNKVIKDLIAKEEVRQKELEAQEEENENNPLDYNNNNNNNNNNTPTGKWYFYNATAMSFGVSDFKRIWGNRNNEDDWRRSNKNTISASETPEDTLINKDSLLSIKLTPEYYLAGLPMSDTAMSASHSRRMKAMFKVGGLYKENFRDYPESISAFELLLKEYDTTSYKLPAYYQLYRLNLEIPDDDRAEYYRKLVINGYPESEYAQIILDPSHAKTTRENRKRVENYYLRIYELYKLRNYETVITRCEKSNAIFPENHLQGKYDLLRAMSIGYLRTKEEFKTALEEVVKQHKETPEAKRAQEVLDMLNASGPSIVKSPYKMDVEAIHKVVVLIPTTDKSVNKYKIEVSNFNGKNFGSKVLKLDEKFLNAEYRLIMVDKFEGKQAALNYLSAFKGNLKELITLNTKNYQSFVISVENFGEFYRTKDVDGYVKFFESNYTGD